MYHKITKRFLSHLVVLSSKFAATGDLASQLRALDVGLSQTPTFSATSTVSEISLYLEGVSVYSNLCVKLLSQGGIDIFDLNTQRLFGRDTTSRPAEGLSADIRILPSSPLLKARAGLEPLPESLEISPSKAVELTMRFIAQRLEDFLFSVSEHLEVAPILFHPCSINALNSGCSGQEHCRRLHVSGPEMTETAFRARLAALARILLMVEEFNSLVLPSSAATRKSEKE